MTENEVSTDEAAARRRVWSLLARHPELHDRVRTGDLVARYRVPANDDARKHWTIMWSSILEEMEALLRKSSVASDLAPSDPGDREGDDT